MNFNKAKPSAQGDKMLKGKADSKGRKIGKDPTQLSFQLVVRN